MKRSRGYALTFFALALAVTLASVVNYQAQRPLPNPVIYITNITPIKVSGKDVVRYEYDVFNKSDYPNDLFAASPDLPPCGANKNASRSWIDVFDQRGKRLYGFCALLNTKSLNSIWFTVDAGTVPPSWIYIEINDRKTNTKYKSNLAETTL